MFETFTSAKVFLLFSINSNQQRGAGNELSNNRTVMLALLMGGAVGLLMVLEEVNINCFRDSNLT